LLPQPTVAAQKLDAPVLSGYLKPGQSESYSYKLDEADWHLLVAASGVGDVDIYVYNGLWELITKDDSPSDSAEVNFNAAMDGAICKIVIKNGGDTSFGYYGQLEGTR
jgi:hypothetical protein